MRRAARVDDNQAQIVSGLRAIGCTVRSIAAVGDGLPDLIVGYRRRNLLLECKDGEKPVSRRQLTVKEQEFAETWRGQWAKVESVEQAISVVTSECK